MLNLRNRFKKNIKFRSLLLIAGAVTIIQLFSTIIITFVNQNNLKDSFFQRVTLLTNIQAEALANPIWDFNNETVTATLTTLTKEPSVIFASILDTENKVTSSVGADTDSFKSIVISSPIIYTPKNKNLGTLSVKVSLEDLDQKFKKMVGIAVLNFLILQIFILGATYLILINIINPLQQITHIVTLIKDNNLDNEVPSTTRLDEIGAIANAVQSLQMSTKDMNNFAKLREQEKEDRNRKMTSLIEQFFEDSSKAIKSVECSSVELDNTSKEMSNIIGTVDKKVSNVTNVSQRTSKNIKNVTDSTAGMNGAIEEISQQMSKSKNIVLEAVTKTENAKTTTDSLDKAMNKIGEVVLFIAALAKQVNLLALNATIESARAGKAGLGFAVVASEIKKLANQTSKATEDIAQKITNVQVASTEVVSSITSIEQSINVVSQAAVAVSSAVEEQHVVTETIFTNMKLATDGACEVDNDVLSIKDLTSIATNSTTNVLSASKTLSNQAELLSQLINNFIQEIRKI